MTMMMMTTLKMNVMIGSYAADHVHGGLLARELVMKLGSIVMTLMTMMILMTATTVMTLTVILMI